MRCKGLTAEHWTIGGNGCFKAFGVEASVWELTVFFALLLPSDTRNIAQDVPKPTAKDVAFVAWHLQRFLDGIGEAISGKSEVLEHGRIVFGFAYLLTKFMTCKHLDWTVRVIK